MARNSRSFRSRGISESQRRKKSWFGFADAGSVQTGNRLVVPAGVSPGSTLTIVGIDSATAASIGVLEGTVLRIRGSMDMPKSEVSSFSGDVFAFGIGFVTDEAFNAGAVPNPASSEGPDWDGWLFYRSQAQGNLDANSGIVDSKAMRKWQSGTTLCLIAGNSNNDGAGPTGGIVTLLLRGLFLLP